MPISTIDKSDPILPSNKALGYRRVVYITINRDSIQQPVHVHVDVVVSGEEGKGLVDSVVDEPSEF